MYLIVCPYCGPRAQAEFVYERVAEAVIDPAAPDADALSSLFKRTNPMGVDREIWRHSFGCRAWLMLTRNRVTHAIAAVDALGPEALP